MPSTWPKIPPVGNKLSLILKEIKICIQKKDLYRNVQAALCKIARNGNNRQNKVHG